MSDLLDRIDFAKAAAHDDVVEENERLRERIAQLEAQLTECQAASTRDVMARRKMARALYGMQQSWRPGRFW